MILTEAELAAIRRQAEAEYPAECCGVVLARPGGGDRRLHACRNIQDELHGRDPPATRAGPGPPTTWPTRI